jgi:hypothetical protein
LFKTFIFGLVLGALAAGGLLYSQPIVDLEREHSMGESRINGGVIETYYVDLSTDRVMAGIAGAETSVPPGLGWPEYDFLVGTQTEVFKLRNAADNVVGIASRMVGGGDQAFVEWVVHMPARGTMYALLPHDASGPGVRAGILRTGTREFSMMTGFITERYIAKSESDDADAAGRLELVTSLVSPNLVEDQPVGEEE